MNSTNRKGQTEMKVTFELDAKTAERIASDIATGGDLSFRPVVAENAKAFAALSKALQLAFISTWNQSGELPRIY
jgi:hypothetical protein